MAQLFAAIEMEITEQKLHHPREWVISQLWSLKLRAEYQLIYDRGLQIHNNSHEAVQQIFLKWISLHENKSACLTLCHLK